MFSAFTQQHCDSLLTLRPNETKLGQQVYLASTQWSLAQNARQAKSAGAQFAIIAIAEDVGPRANLGRGGADDAFIASMQQLLNLQSNRFLNGNECAILGQISLDHSLPITASIEQLRDATAQLDDIVITAISDVMQAGLEPIVIGGGHNNAYGLLMATKAITGLPVAAVNLDPHSDFRPREGRHSGNGFSYAAANGALDHYHILGLHELKNSEQTLEQLSLFGATWNSVQQIWIRRELSLETALKQIAKSLNQTQLPVALELDVDAIANMPSSAATFAGIPLLDACHYVHYIAKHCSCRYAHFAEAAPACHHAGIDAGYRDAGQSLSELIYAYIQGRLTCLN
ncbi:MULTISPECIES: formimidoylglutamase [Shewanella]|jgi:formiminoglutamase|nr:MULTISPECIES: formimidoylglutamase [Shewanella]NCQ46924.1 formimidoylglutamase [Shewanella frigidimarina]NCO73248.1 formimidoylglutamase [Shewanella vesiculosa]NCP38295.1 formimidoylglutamase [Shewanella vesiculosa]NCP71672.1 formimidoylglutamase [Shewanella vesiculosa]NCP76028.1 formimidoylglutamase [Shewanella vesiculosa]